MENQIEEFKNDLENYNNKLKVDLLELFETRTRRFFTTFNMWTALVLFVLGIVGWLKIDDAVDMAVNNLSKKMLPQIIENRINENFKKYEDVYLSRINSKFTEFDKNVDKKLKKKEEVINNLIDEKLDEKIIDTLIDKIKNDSEMRERFINIRALSDKINTLENEIQTMKKVHNIRVESIPNDTESNVYTFPDSQIDLPESVTKLNDKEIQDLLNGINQ